MKYQIRNGSVTLGNNTILEEVNFEVLDRSKIAIVGKNGAGKTTLLKAIIDNSLFDEGVGDEDFSITKIGNINIGYLEQIIFDDDNISMLDELSKSFSNLIEMENRLEKLLNDMSSNYSDDIINKYTKLEDEFRLLGGYTYRREIEVIISKFNFSSLDKNKSINEFSGGQRTKIALMKLLLSKPDILLLDEPTNHLDIDTIIWLEEYLKNYKSAVILVSHDREFINNIVNVIYDIDYGKTVKYVGNYEFFENEKRNNYDKLLKNYIYQQREINRLSDIYKRFRSKPTKARMALSKLKQIERMDIIDKPNPLEDRTFHTNIDNIEKSGRLVLSVKDLVIGYDRALGCINLELERGRKLGIIGKNGTGKSTFLKTIYSIIKPISGSFNYGTNVKAMYFDQNVSTLNNDNTVLEEFHNDNPNLGEGECRNALGSFLFKGEDVFKRVSVLSGGEKVRLELCKILYKKPNFLILDEPTNHMDIVGKEHLETVLKEYTGTIMFVSHDRYFVNKIADSLLIFDDNIEYYPYTYKEWNETKKENNEKIEKKVAISKKDKKINNSDIKKIEKKIAKLEEELEMLNSELYKEEVYCDYNKSRDISDRINSVLEELDKSKELLNSLLSNN